MENFLILVEMILKKKFFFKIKSLTVSKKLQNKRIFMLALFFSILEFLNVSIVFGFGCLAFVNFFF